jgi:hypothetical protein
MRTILWSVLALSVAPVLSVSADEPGNLPATSWLELCPPSRIGCRAVFVGATREEALARASIAPPEARRWKIFLAWPKERTMIQKLQQIAGSVSYDATEDPVGGKATRVGLSGTHLSDVLTATWRIEGWSGGGGIVVDTQAVVEGLFVPTMKKLTEGVDGGVTWNVIWRTHGYRTKDGNIDQSSLKPEDRGEWAARHYSDWTVGFGIGYALLVGNVKFNLYGGLFHEARVSDIQLRDRVEKGPDGQNYTGSYDFQNYSENRNGVMSGISFSGNRFLIAGDLNWNLGKRSYLIMGDYDNDGAYDYDHDGTDANGDGKEEDDYEYGFFPKEGVRPVGHIYVQYQVWKNPRSPWVGAEVSNIGQKPERMSFPEFQAPLPGGPQVKLRVLIPLNQGRKRR